MAPFDLQLFAVNIFSHKKRQVCIWHNGKITSDHTNAYYIIETTNWETIAVEKNNAVALWHMLCMHGVWWFRFVLVRRSGLTHLYKLQQYAHMNVHGYVQVRTCQHDAHITYNSVLNMTSRRNATMAYVQFARVNCACVAYCVLKTTFDGNWQRSTRVNGPIFRLYHVCRVTVGYERKYTRHNYYVGWS